VPDKRHAIVLCFLRAALGETTDAVVEMQDKLITGVHNKARQRREDILRATEEARRRAVEVLEEVGSLVLDGSIPDAELRRDIFAGLPRTDMERSVEGCRHLREGDDGSHLRFVTHWYPLVDVLIDMDNRTDFLRHFLHYGAGETRLPAVERRRNSLAALIAVGCNIGPQRMAVASDLRVHEISEVATATPSQTPDQFRSSNGSRLERARDPEPA
jgi:hypothetical protein